MVPAAVCQAVAVAAIADPQDASRGLGRGCQSRPRWCAQREEHAGENGEDPECASSYVPVREQTRSVPHKASPIHGTLEQDPNLTCQQIFASKQGKRRAKMHRE